MIGTRLSHYLLVEEVGAGGMGVVYRARDERLERDVAVKVLPAGSLDDTTRLRFRREAVALSRLNHPHIGMIHDFGTDQGTDFLVMELVRGRTLRQRLREGPLPLEEAVEIATAVAEALEEAHEQGVIHRDLKPENVLLTTKGWVKVLDFGLASLRPAHGSTVTTETLTAANVLTGTLPYMAPEQLLGKPAGARTDLYALGVLLYELATGTRPFEADVQAALIGEILHKKAAAPSSRRVGIPLWFDGVVMRCLEKETSGRFESASALKAALKAGARAEASAGAPAPPPAPGSGGIAGPGFAVVPPGSGGVVPSGSPAIATPPAVPATPASGFPHGLVSQAVNPEAYDAVLRGRQIIGRRTEESMRRGIEYIRRAIELDPLYPPAFAALATAYDLMGFFGMAAPADCYPRARVAASRAIELDPRWAPGYSALAYVFLYYDWDFRKAEEYFLKCMELDPQYSIGPLWYANLLCFESRFHEADAAVKRAQSLDPLSSIVTMSRGWTRMFEREPALALPEYRKATDFDPEFHVAHWMAAWVLSDLGRHDEAVASVTRAIEVSKGLLICYPTLARAHALAGRKDEARRVLAELEAKSPARFVEPLEVALAYEALGERDTAFAWLERALKERSHWLVAMGVDPRFDSLREDARFVALREKVGVGVAG
ncbi:MAG TPA: serine/threonine-protein kinase [Candidatus Eisenbacteria bacterium]|nr:serine/threonine-protein kinase [Candidatus Eisenbacteria bacterium]